MEKIFDWIKNNKRKTMIYSIIGILILIVGIPIIIHVLYIIPAPIWWLDTAWEAEHVLEYYGAILGFLGTVVLSALALYQNYEIKRESDARQVLIEKMAYAKEMPLFIVKNSSCGGNYSNLCVSIFNISDNAAYDLNVSKFTVANVQGDIVLEALEAKIRRTELLGKVETEIEFTNRALYGENLKIAFQLKCKDKLQNAHIYNVSLQIEDAKKFSSKKYVITEL